MPGLWTNPPEALVLPFYLGDFRIP